MTKTNFCIGINIKTAKGFETIGKFNIGHEKGRATDLFKRLEGSSSVDESSLLTMELIESVQELPVNLLMISCNLEQLAANCREISKEIFKMKNLKEIT